MSADALEDAIGFGQPLTAGTGNTRRLALNACEPCRQRKAKCDEGQPQCGRCSRLRLACRYKEPHVKKDPVLLHIRQSLASLESKMDALRGLLLQREGDPSRSSPYELLGGLPGAGSRGLESTGTLTAVPAHSAAMGGHGAAAFTTEQDSPLPSTPLHHSTAPQNILLWPCLQIKCLSKAFFDELSIYSPLLVESVFADHILGPVLTGTSTSELDVCIVLLVLFLGGKALGDQEESDLPDDPHGALGVFLDPIEADVRLSQLSLRVRYSAEISWRSAQALLLTGLHYSQRINVLEHFHAVQRACTVIMILLQSNPRPNPNEIQIYWVAYAHESQLLAEFELPPSGIARYEDMIPFPFSEYRNAEEPRSVHRMAFLAHLALRNLLNRIHANIYGHGSRHSPNDTLSNTSGLTASSSLSTGFSTSMSIIKELDHQLELWREHLPTELAFPTLAQMNPWQREGLTKRRAASPSDRAIGALKARYCAAKSIILRPFLYELLNSPPQEGIPASSQEIARLCLLAVLQAALHQGILRDSIRGIPMPINLIRCFFAGAILLRLVDRRPDLHSLLPADWKVIHDIQDRVEADAACLSPTIAEDMQILRRLDYMPRSIV
ncbi:hypothetical protein BJX76DRAFT_98373 [Aspergillus varians]